MQNRVPFSPLQKVARYNLAVFIVALLLYCVAILIFVGHFHRTWSEAALPAMGVFGLCGLWGCGVFFMPEGKNYRSLDEREREINQRAATLGMNLFWLVFCFLCTGIWAFMQYGRHQETIPVIVLPLLVMLGWIVHTVVYSGAILWQFHWGAEDGN